MLTNAIDDAIMDLRLPFDESSCREKDFPIISVRPASVPTDLEAEKEQVPAWSEQIGFVDSNLVTWDGPDDPINPMNWKFGTKIGALAIVSTLNVLVPLGSSMFAPGVPSMMTEFDNSNSTLASFVVSIYVLGFAIGPLIVGPLSEMYGRLIVYKVSMTLFTALTIGAGECNNFISLIVLRLLAGLIGSTSLVIGAGSVADVIPIEKRGRYMNLYILGPTLGPAIGPVIGGFLSAVNWRWVFRVIGTLSGVMTIVVFVFLPETYGPYVLHVKANRLRKETGNEKLHTEYEDRMSGKVAHFMKNIIRPCKLLIMSPIVLIMSIYVAITYGQLYLLLTTFTDVFQNQYKFSTEAVGLTYIAMGLGTLISILTIVRYSDRILLNMAAKSGDKKPEYRLWLLLVLSPMDIIGLLIYGWTVRYAVHWIVPLIGTFCLGIGIFATFSPTTSYLVDAYTIYAASANSASTMVRSLGGAFLPLAGPRMYAALGYGWGNTLLALIMLAITPAPFLMYFKGESLRKRFNPSL
ncbi:major facilitator superfamily domain-containing protein [Lipomyces tetrasporus]